jgi:predicted acyl esterase
MKHLFLLLLATSALADVKTQTISVPMRDGIKLATDITEAYRNIGIKITATE